MKPASGRTGPTRRASGLRLTFSARLARFYRVTITPVTARRWHLVSPMIEA